MGLKSDIDEVKTAWSQATPLAKVYLALSLFLSTSAIASLTDTIVQWKGFFRNALAFYHEWINAPLIELFLAFGLRIAPEAGDYIVVVTLLISSAIRLSLHWAKHGGGVKQGSMLSYFLWVIPPSSLYMLLREGSAPKTTTWVFLGLVFLAPLFFLPLQEKRAYYTPILCAVFAVGIFAAINTGLSA